MNTREAKEIIEEVLAKNGLSNKLTAKTIDFIDLARNSCVFVQVWNWESSPLADTAKQAAKANGFCVEFHQ